MRVFLLRSAAGDGVNTRAHMVQRQSCTVSSFLARVPLRTSLTLPQSGQRSGRLAVWETRAGAGRRACGAGSIAPGGGRVVWERAASGRHNM